MVLIIVDNFLESFKFFLVLYFGFELKFRANKIRNIVISIVLIFFYSIYNVYMKDTTKLTSLIMAFILYVVVIGVSIYIVFREKILKLSFLTIWVTLLLNLCDGLTLVFLRVVYIMNNMDYRDEKIAVFVDMVTLFILFFSYRFIFKRKNYSLKEIKIGKLFNILIVSICYIFILSMIWTIYLSQIVKSKHGANMYIVFIFLLIATYYHLVIMLEAAITNEKLKYRNIENRNLLFMQEKQYSYVNQLDLETKKFRHDINHHLLILASFFKDKKWEAAETYFEQMNLRVADISMSQYVNHSIVDVILRQFESQCKEKDILFKVKGFIPSECKIEHYDLTTVIMNTLQNAYEAVLNVEKKQIDMIFRFDETFLYIVEENTFDGILLEEKGEFQTRKKNKKLHGFGFANIIESVKKYDGEYFYEVIKNEFDDSIFRFTIAMSLYERV